MPAGSPICRKLRIFKFEPGHTARPTWSLSAGCCAAFRLERAQFWHSGIHAAHGGDRPRFPLAYSFKDGFMHPGETPGIGVDIEEKLAAQFPYQRAYLPVNRTLDG